MPSIEIGNRSKLYCLVALLMAGFFLYPLRAQVSNPVPDTIQPADFTLILEDLVQLPGGTSPRARLNMLREADDGTGRLFVVDLNGLLYTIQGTSWDLYLNLRSEFPEFISAPGKGTGFGCFAFHPEFRTNGIFYTSHAENAGSGDPDFTPAEFDNIAMQWVVYEWQADVPTANRFEGTRREILRMDLPDVLHGIQEIAFNPVAQSSDEDYGLLYICIGDGGSSKNFQDGNLQSKSSYLGSIFRIDPAGSNSANGAYGIPPTNPNAGDTEAVQEVYCFGFRNPHRISWDLEGDHKMLIGDIGEKNIEEVNIGQKGNNYGWSQREGTFLYDRAAGRDFVWPLPPDDSIHNYTYPAVMYDHDEGFAVVGGYVYRGSAIPELTDMYLFGDIVNGRTFVVPIDQLTSGNLTQPEEVMLTDTEGTVIRLNQLGTDGRADLRFGRDLDGNIYVLTKTDGFVRTLRSPSVSSVNSLSTDPKVNISPNPASEFLQWSTENKGSARVWLHSSTGICVFTEITYSSDGVIDISELPAGVYTFTYERDGNTTASSIVIAR